MNKANDLALLDEFLNSEPFMDELDKMAAAYPLCQEARADFDRALEAVKPRLDNFREWDALDCANTICAVAYAQLGVLYGMRILSNLPERPGKFPSAWRFDRGADARNRGSVQR